MNMEQESNNNIKKADLSRYGITSRLLMKEALRKGYQVTTVPGRLATSHVVRCEKDGKELYFYNLNTALNPSYAVQVNEDKIWTNNILHQSHIQIPDTYPLKINRPEDVVIDDTLRKMLESYERLVVKSATANYSNNVLVNAGDEEGLLRAIHHVYQNSGGQPDIIVQQMVFGQEYRFLVLNKKVIAVAYRRPPYIVGDGVSTIRTLISKKNNNCSKHGNRHTSLVAKINIEDVLRHKGAHFLQQVPEKGSVVEILDTLNLSRGGEAVDVTSYVSDELKTIAIQAASACFLGIAGIDIVTDNISGDGNDSYVVRVKASPGIRMHQFPTEGKPRNVARKLFHAIEKTAHPIGKKIVMIGRVEKVALPDFINEKFKARIDTGATVSSIWASDIRVNKTGLYCKLFGEGSPVYTGEELHFSEYSMRSVRSSNGYEELRYQVVINVSLAGRRVKAKVTLADRSGQIYPMLIGRNILRNKFIVHVAEGDIDKKVESSNRQELRQNGLQ